MCECSIILHIGKGKSQESAATAGSLIAKQQQTWTRSLNATPGILIPDYRRDLEKFLQAVAQPCPSLGQAIFKICNDDLGMQDIMLSPREWERRHPEQDRNPLNSSSHIPVPMLKHNTCSP